MAKKLYSEDEAREILKRAVALDTQQEGFSHGQLAGMAEELDISPEALEEAERLWNAEQQRARRPTTREQPVPRVMAPESDERAHRRSGSSGFSLGKLVLFILFISLLGGGNFGWLVPLLVIWAIFGVAGSAGRACGGRRSHH